MELFDNTEISSRCGSVIPEAVGRYCTPHQGTLCMDCGEFIGLHRRILIGTMTGTKDKIQVAATPTDELSDA